MLGQTRGNYTVLSKLGEGGWVPSTLPSIR